MKIDLSDTTDLNFKPNLYDVHSVLDQEIVGEYRARMSLFTNFVLANKFVLMAGPRSSGKCIAEGTEIVNSYGEVVKVENLKDRVLLVPTRNNVTMKVEQSEAKVVENGICDCFELTTKTGRKIIVNDKHPFLTGHGWKSVSDGLKEQDEILSPNKLPIFGALEPSNEEVKVLAYLIADGGITTGQITFSKQDECLVNDFTNAAKTFGYDCVKFDGKSTYFFKNTETRYVPRRKCYRRCQTGRLLELLKKHNLAYKKSTEKELSNEMFVWSEEKLKLFLRLLFSCDGSIYKSKNREQYTWGISYSSSSDKLIRQVQHLLLRFGIVSTLRTKKVTCRGKEFTSYELCIWSKGIDKFIETIGFYGNKREKQNEYMMEEMQFRTNYKYSNSIDFFFEEIKSIVPVGKKMTYDLSVPETQNFIANDILSHNTWISDHIRDYFLGDIELGTGTAFSITMGSKKAGWYQMDKINRASHIFIFELNQMPEEFIEILKQWGEGKAASYKSVVNSGGAFTTNNMLLQPKPTVFCLADEQELKVGEQLTSRLTTIRTDSSIEQNKRVMTNQAILAKSKDNKRKVDAERLMKLKEHISTMPAFEKIEFKNPAADEFVNSIPPFFTDCRRDFPKYLDNTNGITRYHWKDRIRIDRGKEKTLMFVTPEDMFLNHIIYGQTLIESALKCSNLEREIIEIVKALKVPVTRATIQRNLRKIGFNVSSHMVSRHLTTLTDIGYLDFANEGKEKQYVAGDLFNEFKFTVNWEAVVEASKKGIKEEFPEVAEDYINKYCTNPFVIHPFSGKKINILDIKQETIDLSQPAGNLTNYVNYEKDKSEKIANQRYKEKQKEEDKFEPVNVEEDDVVNLNNF